MSLFNGKEFLDQSIDYARNGKSDLLLENISVFLDKNKIDIADIKRIVLAENTRSRTAYKIAVSTLKGISLINGTEIISADLFESIGKYFMETICGDFVLILQIDPDRFEFAVFNKHGKKSAAGRTGLGALKEKIETIVSNEKICLLTSVQVRDNNFERYIKEFDAEKFEHFEIGKNLSRYL